MSEAAAHQKEVQQHWAEPGSRHDRLVKLLKVGLPSAVGVLAAFLLMAPLTRQAEVSFILDKNEVDTAPERMRIEAARYTGTDNRGQPFSVQANRAIQQSSDQPVVDIMGMFARLGLASGPATIQAQRGRYNIDQQQVKVAGPVRVSGPEGEQLATRDLLVNFRTRTLRSEGPVSGRIELGQFQAGRVRADLGQRVVVLDGGARLKIEQGAVR